MASKKTFNFKLNDAVALAGSFAITDAMGNTKAVETGVVVGRAHYINSDPQYYVRYTTAQGCQVEQWLAEDAIVGYNS